MTQGPVHRPFKRSRERGFSTGGPQAVHVEQGMEQVAKKTRGRKGPSHVDSRLGGEGAKKGNLPEADH